LSGKQIAYYLMKYFYVFSLWLLPFLSFSEELLSFSDALAQALAGNYDVKIAKQQTDILKTENNWTNAGFIPRLNATTGGYNFVLIEQKLANGTVIERKGATFQTLIRLQNKYTAKIAEAYLLFLTGQILN